MKPVNFYEVFDDKMNVEMGTASPLEAIRWYRRYPNRAVFVSVWDEESEEDFKLLQDRIEITPLILATLATEEERR